MKAEHVVPLRVPIESVDLENWIFTLSDEDYQAASKAHRAAGTTMYDGVRGTVNVEDIGGTLIVQHYREVSADRRHFELFSPRSRGYFFHLIPIRMEVRWTMSAEPRGATGSSLRCVVEINLAPVLRLLSKTSATGWFVRRHVREEAAGFARDIERKHAEGRTPPSLLIDRRSG
ncbi:hypothetical protein [Acrocarpospora corrugata]|nr:hypothetical protein [Acrocarpospora corrugata]